MMVSSCFQAKEKGKNHRGKKKTKEGRELTSLLYIWDEALLLPSPLHIP
jgi:hypothetical protein